MFYGIKNKFSYFKMKLKICVKYDCIINYSSNLYNWFFFEKSDYDKMKEVEKLPPFTKEQAEQYYFNELKSK